MKFRKITQHGQVLALYGLLIPFLLLFVGVGLDLGWYYLNVSRLQNAADAAALAGAQALVEKEYAFEDYYVVSLASNALPEDFDDYENVYKNTFGTVSTGKLYNYKKTDDVADTLKNGRAYAEEYARKNLSDAEAVISSTDNKDTLIAVDGWSISVKNEDKKVNGKIELKYKIVDGKNDVYGPLYYVVSLHEKIRHFFMAGWFEDMDAPVRAVVLLQPHDKNLVVGMQSLERSMVIDNWEYTNKYKGTTGFYAGKWNHYMSGDKGAGVAYAADNPYRTEGMSVTTKELGKNGGQKTDANGGKFYSASEVDSINIDFQAEVRVKSNQMFTTDWDLNMGTAAQLSNFSGYARVETINGEASWGIGNGDDKRILFNVKFDEAFPTREDKKKDKADPLWTRIESEPIIRQIKANGDNVDIYNSVRQVTLNFNSNNTAVEGSGENQYYKYRPYVIFYTGPENVDYATNDKGVLIRHSQPVVVNLNEDTNAIMYFPESPVVLNGNGHKLTGFIIAKCFLFAVTSEDMTNKKTFERYDGFNAPENVTGDFSEYTVKYADGSKTYHLLP